MSYPDGNGLTKDSVAEALSPAEVTLRMIARLPAPQGLEDRVQAGLLTAPRQGRLLAWPRALPMAGGWMRGAAAAAIVCVVAGGGWGIYSRVQPRPAGLTTGSGGFSTSEAVRRPKTLEGPAVVTHAVGVPATAAPKAPVKAVPVTTKNVKATVVGKPAPVQPAAPVVQ
jgi:hypothetical protein